MSDAAAISAFIGFAPGAIGGVCNVFVGHPVDLVKVRMQTASSTALASAANTDTFAALRTIYATGGVKGLYRGVSAPLLAVVPAFAVTIYSHDFAARYMLRRSGNHELTNRQEAIAGAFAGIPTAFVAAPSERIKCSLQVHGYSGFGDCAKQLYNEGGIRSLFRGGIVTLLRDVPGNAVYFGGYSFFKNTFRQMEGRETASFGSIFAAGGLAGVCNWIVAIPFDVLKSRQQTAPAGMYRNLGHVLQVLLHQEGFGALFRGLSPALIRAFPANGACLAGVETARTAFSHLSLS